VYEQNGSNTMISMKGFNYMSIRVSISE